MRRGVSPATPLRTGSNGLRYRFFASLRMTAKGLRMTGQNGEAGIANMIQKKVLNHSFPVVTPTGFKPVTF